jgi:hypothetical protein
MWRCLAICAELPIEWPVGRYIADTARRTGWLEDKICVFRFSVTTGLDQLPTQGVSPIDPRFAHERGVIVAIELPDSAWIHAASGNRASCEGRGLPVFAVWSPKSLSGHLTWDREQPRVSLFPA